MRDTHRDVQVSRERLADLRCSAAQILRQAHCQAGAGATGLRGLVRGLRQSLRWAAFKIEMLGIASDAHYCEAREELEVVLAVADQNRTIVQRYLASVDRRIGA